MSGRPELLVIAAEIRDRSSRVEREVADIEALTTSAPDRTATWAIAGHLQAFYTGCETMLQAALERFDGLPSHGADSHVRLLRAATLAIPTIRPAVLAESTAAVLDPYRAFRHFFRHGYGLDLDWSRMESKVLGIRAAHAAFARDIDAFCAFLDAVGTG